MSCALLLAFAEGGPPAIFFPFFFLAGFLGISAFLFFTFNRNAALKRRVFPVFIISIGLAFAWLAFHLAGRLGHRPPLFFLLAIILVTLLNLRAFRFCASCGRTLTRQSLFHPLRFCPYCGAALP